MSPTPETPPRDGKITIRVTWPQDPEPIAFRVKATAPFQKIFNELARLKGVGPGAFNMMLDGERINLEQTPKMLELQDGDLVDIGLAQVGGSPLLRETASFQCTTFC